jgi:hypothetical protein
VAARAGTRGTGRAPRAPSPRPGCGSSPPAWTTWSPRWTATVPSGPTWTGWSRPWNATSCPCPSRPGMRWPRPALRLP